MGPPGLLQQCLWILTVTCFLPSVIPYSENRTGKYTYDKNKWHLFYFTKLFLSHGYRRMRFSFQSVRCPKFIQQILSKKSCKCIISWNKKLSGLWNKRERLRKSLSLNLSLCFCRLSFLRCFSFFIFFYKLPPHRHPTAKT